MMTCLFTMHDMDDETPVQYVGVYVLNWRGEWGLPTAMFAPVDDPIYDAAPELLEACKAAYILLDSIRLTTTAQADAHEVFNELERAIAKAEDVQ